MLAHALAHHEGALRASLHAVYGIRLAAHDVGVSELADLTANLPPGCALWVSVGGPNAWSSDVHLLNLIEYRLQVLAWQQTKDGRANRNRPQLRKPPVYASERDEEQMRQDRRMAAWQARQERRATREGS